jgi:hypothetical protein
VKRSDSLGIQAKISQYQSISVTTAKSIDNQLRIYLIQKIIFILVPNWWLDRGIPRWMVSYDSIMECSKYTLIHLLIRLT